MRIKVARDEEIDELLATIKRQEQEIAALKVMAPVVADEMAAFCKHYNLPEGTTDFGDADHYGNEWNGWESRAALQAVTENAQTVPTPEDDAEQLARIKWTVKQWYEHVGAWENAQGEVCFGSVMALGAMLKLMAKARHSIAPVTPQDAIKASTTPQRNLLIVFADILKDVASNEEIDDDWIANRFDFDLKWRHLTLKTGKLNCQDADDLAAAIDAARAKEQPQ